MEEPAFFSQLAACRVVIWGMGLMGGSLAMALKGKCAEIDGIDQDPEAVKLALEMGITGRASTDPGEILPGADLVILAVPVRAILAILDRLPELVPGSTVVMDLGSTKTLICEAMTRLPERIDPVGGHPMCGKEKSSLRYADGSIYTRAPFALAAVGQTSIRAKGMADAVVRSVGALPLWVDPGEHDRWVAATSHIPFLTACALAEATSEEAAALVGPGFRGAARLAGSSPVMMADIATTNSENIRVSLHAVIDKLMQYDAMLAEGDVNAMVQEFGKAANKLHRLTEEAR